MPGVLRERPEDDALQLPGDPGGILREGHGRFGDDARQDCPGVVALERRRAGQERVERRANGVDIRLESDLSSTDLFRRCVGRRAQKGAGEGQIARSVERLRDAEITDLRSPGFIEKAVGGLDIPVENASRVGRLESFDDIQDGIDALRDRHRPPARQPVLQRAPAHQLHADDGIALDVGGAEDKHASRMVHRRRQLSFPLKTGHHLWGALTRRGQDF